MKSACLNSTTWMKTVGHYLVTVCLVITLGCEEETDDLGFVTDGGTAGEGSGKQSLIIDLGSKLTSDVTIQYHVGGSASLNGDYSLLSSNIFYFSTDATDPEYSLVAKAGQSTVALEFEITDDDFIETRDESVYFQITGASDANLFSKFKHVQYEFRISDNDTAPTNGLQVDLSWSLGNGVSIYSANFDLHLARNVVLDSEGNMTSFDLIETPSSTHAKGFESFIIAQEMENEEYYLLIRYVEGSSEANVFLTLSQGNNSGNAAGRVSTDFLGKDVYYGPISKQGNSFQYR